MNPPKSCYNQDMPPLVWTKFKIPLLRTKSVLRPRLLEKLNRGLGCRLILISAPAGFGKTTLLVQWLQSQSLQALWIALEETDDDPIRFFSAWINCLRQMIPSYCDDLLQVLCSAQLPALDLLTAELINPLLQSNQPAILVLDDFQHIQNTVIVRFIQDVITYLPPEFHLAILTREDPALPLARLRSQNELVEIRTNDLRFDPTESSQLFNELLNISLEPSIVKALTERTEGWAAGLQLAGISLQSSPQPANLVQDLSAGTRFMLNYLAEEVLNKQPQDIQDFLLKTSLLSTLTPARCNLLTGREDSAEVLEKLEKSNLFIQPLDEQSHYYRYHALFAELLRNRLNRQGEEEVCNLHLRAAQALLAEGLATESLSHFLAAKEFAAVADLLESHIWDWINHIPAAELEKMLSKIPPEIQFSHPRLQLGLGWLHLLQGNFPRLAGTLQSLENLLAENKPLSDDLALLRAEFLALQANFLQVQQKFDQAIQFARQSLTLIDSKNNRIASLAFLALGGGLRQKGEYEEARAALEKAIQLSRVNDDPVTDILAVSHLTLMALEYGHLELAATTAQTAIHHLEQHPHGYPAVLGAVYGALGWAHYHLNQPELAAQFLLRGIHLAELSGHNASAVYSLAGMARLHIVRGDLNAARQCVQQADQFFQRGAPGWVLPELISCKSRLAVIEGNWIEAEAILTASGVTPDFAPTPYSEPLLIAWLRLAIAQEDIQTRNTIFELVQRLLEYARASRRNYALLQTLIAGAVLHFKKGNAIQTRQWLDEAVQVAAASGYRSIFLEHRQDLLPILKSIRMPALEPFLCPLGETQASISSQKPPSSARYQSGITLTEREQEVLRLLAQGHTYNQIAEQLVVSLNTVRFHVKGIYGKLGVTKVNQAIAEARRQGLI
ncbi:MAG: LuxR family transcriptional regulator [Bellilinea sp.]|nr:MAG: LuxR family transcriptional regulator [Bellilinea sp.]